MLGGRRGEERAERGAEGRVRGFVGFLGGWGSGGMSAVWWCVEQRQGHIQGVDGGKRHMAVKFWRQDGVESHPGKLILGGNGLCSVGGDGPRSCSLA